MRNKVLGPSAAVGTKKPEGFVKHPAGSTAELFTGKTGKPLPAHLQAKIPQKHLEQTGTRVSAPARRVPDKKVPVRIYEPDTLFTPLSGMNGHNNANLSDAELQRIRENIERTTAAEKAAMTGARVGYVDSGSKGSGEEYL